MSELFLRFVERGDISLAGLISHRFSPKDAAAAYELITNRNLTAMGIIFDWTAS